jgi:hypothetical protein
MSEEATSCMGYGMAIGVGILYGFLFYPAGILGFFLVRRGARQFRWKRRLAHDGVLIQATVTEVKKLPVSDGGGWLCTYQYPPCTARSPSRRVLVERTISTGSTRSRHLGQEGGSIAVLMLPEEPFPSLVKDHYESGSFTGLIEPARHIISGIPSACLGLFGGLFLAICDGSGGCGWSKPAILLAISYGIPILLFLYPITRRLILDVCREHAVFFGAAPSRIIEECNISDNDLKEGDPKRLELSLGDTLSSSSAPTEVWDDEEADEQ